MTEELSRACIVVVENGVARIPQIDDPACSLTDRAIIAQSPDETPAELAVRVIRRAQELARNRTPVQCAVIAASDAVDDEVFASRCRIARALVRAMEGAPKANLSFVAPGTLSDDGRHELLSIAGTLAMQLHHVPVEVSVRFESRAELEEPKSEMRLRKPAVVSALAAGVA